MECNHNRDAEGMVSSRRHARNRVDDDTLAVLEAYRDTLITCVRAAPGVAIEEYGMVADELLRQLAAAD